MTAILKKVYIDKLPQIVKKKQYDSKSNVNIYSNIETYIDIFVTCNIKKLKLDIGAHVQI